MAAHSNGQAIIFFSCGYFLLLLFFLTHSQWSEIGCLLNFHTRCGLGMLNEYRLTG